MQILVTGAANGLGAAIADALTRAGHYVYPFDIQYGDDVRDPQGTYGDCPADLDAVINCAGINITGWITAMDEKTWDDVLDVNAKGIFKVTRWAYAALRANKGTVLNIVSNASHMPMTTSLAYNASKGAAHIMTLQMAREMTRMDGITVFGISPNKLKGTNMSRDIERQVCALRGWTPEYAEKYQLAALLAGEETDPKQLAEFIAYLFTSKKHHKYLAGCILPYGA